MTRAPPDLDQDAAQLALRARLNSHLASSVEPLDRFAARADLSPQALAAFLRGAGLAGWAANSLVAALDEAGR